NLGLIKAAMRFDETKGFKFISYAVWWIRQSILQSLAEQSRIVRLPLNKVGLTNRISKAYQLLEQEYEREPTSQELADFLELPLDEVTATMKAGFKHVSMDSPISSGEDITLIDLLENTNEAKTDDKLVYHESLHVEIERSLGTLTDRQKKILCFFFGIGVDRALSLEDIGTRFNLTRERVRQIKDKAIHKLRSANRARQLRYYLG
ncbi:MAG TPA: RNA polymerase sigma factor RpoD/SigA, partial [Sediminibacterium sp.]|nr:RNA polymerase sigma factor RpoD/SigA [Sediminibacterium sp.]